MSMGRVIEGFVMEGLINNKGLWNWIMNDRGLWLVDVIDCYEIWTYDITTVASERNPHAKYILDRLGKKEEDFREKSSYYRCFKILG